MREDEGIVPRPSRCAVICGLILALAGCASSPPDEDAPVTTASDGSGCRALVGRYADAGRPEGAAAREGDAPPRRTLSQVLELDPSTGASVPQDERAVEILHVAGARYSLSLAKTTQPDAIVLWDTPASCEGDVLRLPTVSRYESTDGVHATRLKMSISLYADADSSLILRRDQRERAVALIDIRRGGGKDVETFRFPRLEDHPAR